VKLPAAAIDSLLRELPGEHPFYVWDEAESVVRWMCSWDTEPADVEALLEASERALAS
jgi:threonine aldolase